jgi:AraC family transcriptional regulator, transcriptional activator of pobA
MPSKAVKVLEIPHSLTDISDFKIIPLVNYFKQKDEYPLDIEKPHRMGYHTILIITSGLGKHFIDFKPVDYTNGTVIFVSKEQVQSFDIKPGNSGYLIFFTDEFMEKNSVGFHNLSHTWLYNYHVNIPKIQVNAELREHFFDIIDKIYQEYRAGSKYAQTEVIKTLLYLLLIKSERIKRELIDHDALNRSNMIFEFIDLTRDNLSKTRNAKDIAKLMKISYKHLNNVCKQCLNKTSKEFIDEYIVIEAKRTLISTDYTVKEITAMLGFDEPTNFVKYFKKHTGFSPAGFRKKHL